MNNMEGMQASDCDNLKVICTKCDWQGGIEDCHCDYDRDGQPLCPECDADVEYLDQSYDMCNQGISKL